MPGFYKVFNYTCDATAVMLGQSLVMEYKSGNYLYPMLN